MGSKTIDLEIAVLHKTIKTPQQYFHTESLLTAMAKPLPAPRTPGVGGTRCGPGAPILWADKGETAGSSGARRAAPAGAEAGGAPLGALRARGGSAREGRGGAAGSGLRVAAPDAARTAGSRAAPGCRARGVREGARPGHKGQETARRRRRAASHYRSRGAGSGPSARAPLRRGSMSRSAERGARAARGVSGRTGASTVLAAPSPRSRQEGLGARRGRRMRAGLCVRGGRRDQLRARLLASAGAAVPAEESQLGQRAVRAL